METHKRTINNSLNNEIGVDYHYHVHNLKRNSIWNRYRKYYLNVTVYFLITPNIDIYFKCYSSLFYKCIIKIIEFVGFWCFSFELKLEWMHHTLYNKFVWAHNVDLCLSSFGYLKKETNSVSISFKSSTCFLHLTVGMCEKTCYCSQ